MTGALMLPGYVDGIDVSSVQRIDDAVAAWRAYALELERRGRP